MTREFLRCPLAALNRAVNAPDVAPNPSLASVAIGDIRFNVMSRRFNMKKVATTLLALLILLVLWAEARTHSSLITDASPGNIADGMYTIVGEASRRCLEVPHNS